ncbi:thioesterase domain-containing protein, partial [Latilactobacillus sakei subsp. carnosus]
MSSPLGGRLEYDLQKIVEGWGGERQRPEALIVGFHTQGTLPPLYWCCQGRDELLPLVELMGVERPIYAMRSLSQLVKRPQRDNPALAARYVDEILQLQPEGPYYVGGFSEGGRIAHH